MLIVLYVAGAMAAVVVFLGITIVSMMQDAVAQWAILAAVLSSLLVAGGALTLRIGDTRAFLLVLGTLLVALLSAWLLRARPVSGADTMALGDASAPLAVVAVAAFVIAASVGIAAFTALPYWGLLSVLMILTAIAAAGLDRFLP